MVLSEVGRLRQRVNVLVIDDMQSQMYSIINSNNSSNIGVVDSNSRQMVNNKTLQQRRDQYIRVLISLQHENSIFFSHLPLKEEHNKYFKSIPFLLFLELYCFVNIDTHQKDWVRDRDRDRDKERDNRDNSRFGNNNNGS